MWMRQADLFERVDGRLQMPPRKMQIDGRRLQIRMAEHHLNASQVGAGFQKVGGKAVSQGMRRYTFLDTRAKRASWTACQTILSVIGLSARQLFTCREIGRSGAASSGSIRAAVSSFLAQRDFPIDATLTLYRRGASCACCRCRPP